MIKINKREFNTNKDDDLIVDLVKNGDLKEIKEGEFIWTKKSLEKTKEDLIILNKRLNSPLWDFYYKLIGK